MYIISSSMKMQQVSSVIGKKIREQSDKINIFETRLWKVSEGKKIWDHNKAKKMSAKRFLMGKVRKTFTFTVLFLF